MKVDQRTLEILQHVEITGTALRITEQLERSDYERVNKVLTAAGGKWARNAKAHIFPGSAEDALEQVLLTGEIDKPQDFGFFETPPELVKKMIGLARIEPGMDLLEPSAGTGRIAMALYETKPRLLMACELLEKNLMLLKGNFSHLQYIPNMTLDLRTGDFLKLLTGPQFDRIVMNPPFAKRADIHHITHAAKFLRPGGILVSVASSSVAWRDDKLATEFRRMVVQDHGGEIIGLPEGTFKSSGTMVNTCLVCLAR